MAVVRFDARGISGYIRFSEVAQGVRIEANLQGLRGECKHFVCVCLLYEVDNHHDYNHYLPHFAL